MRPLSLHLENFRSYREQDFTFTDGLAALVGANGSGKSSLVSAIDVALFGPEGRSLAPYYSTDGVGDMVIELVFEHDGLTYRVRRLFSPKGRGASWTEWALLTEDGWLPETRETQEQTQKVIERVLGFGRESFRASSFLAQGYGSAFCESSPSDRKRILADVLGLSTWDALLDLTRARKRTVEQEIAALSQSIQRADSELGERERVSLALNAATDIAARESTSLAGAEGLLAKIVAEHGEAREKLSGHEALVAQVAAENSAAVASYQQRKAERDRLRQRAQDIFDDRERLTVEAADLAEQADAERTRAAEVDTIPGVPCETCGTKLHNEAQAKAAETHRARAADLDQKALAVRVKIAALQDHSELVKQAEAIQVGEPPEPKPAPEAPVSREVIDGIKTRGVQARAAVEEHKRTLESARAEIVRCETTLERLDEIGRQRQDDVIARADLNVELSYLNIEEKSRGRNGIPLLIIEAVVPQIETEANRILAELGTSYRIELRTQAEKKTGELRDTLDVIVWTETTDRPFESFSGGERTRIALALRIALARLLATRRGAESRLLAIDEPDGLDAQGMAALVDVLRGLQDTFDVVLVISHQQALQDAFDTVIAVEKVSGVSRIVGDREAVTA